MMTAMVMKLFTIGLNEVKKFIPKLWGHGAGAVP